MERIIKFCTIVLSILCMLSCSKADILHNHVEQICTQSESDSILVNLNDLYCIDADKIYIIGEVCNNEIIRECIKIPYNNYDWTQDSMYRIIFIKDDKVVLEFDMETDYIRFESEDMFKCLNSPIFVVKRGKGSEITLVNIPNSR